MQKQHPTELNAEFDLSDSPARQAFLLGICALLCDANNETATSNSRCDSYIFQQYRNESKMAMIFNPPLPPVNLEALAYRRLEYCGIADFAEYVLSLGIDFPITNRQTFLSSLHNYSIANPNAAQAGLLGMDEVGNLRFVRMQVLTSLSSKETGAGVAGAVYQAWVQFFNELLACSIHTTSTTTTAAVGMEMQPLISSELFAESETELSTVSGFLSSWLITTAVAVLAIAIYTRSIFMAFVTGLTMSCIILCSFGFCFYLLQWSFGLIEAVGFTVIIGITVDYSAHICYMFTVSKQENSKGKVNESLNHIGLAILSSCLTTVAACSLLFGTIIVPFQMFGALVCASIILSLLYSFFFLAPVLILFGWMPTALWKKRVSSCW